MLQINIVHRAPGLDDYRRLRAAVGWGNGDPVHQRIGLDNALFSVCAVTSSGETIGCGRVVGDRGIYFYLQDVIVLPSHQRQGIGRRIVEALMDYIHTHAAPGAFVALMAAQGAASFYEPYGFRVRPTDRPGMWFILGE